MALLHEVQADVLAALLHGETERMLGYLAGGNISPRRRVEIYRHNVRSNLRGALRDIYPVTFKLVGKAFFEEAADRYAQAYPSHSGDLNAFGARFAEFIAAYPYAQGLGYLPDMARLEWAWHEVFHAADAAPFDFVRLAAVAEADHHKLRFRLAPAVRLLQPDYPVLRIWAVNQDNYRGDMAVNLEAGSPPLLVRRQGYTLHIDSIERADFLFLQGLMQGSALQEVAALRDLPEDPGFLSDALRRYVQNGVVAGFG